MKDQLTLDFIAMTASKPDDHFTQPPNTAAAHVFGLSKALHSLGHSRNDIINAYAFELARIKAGGDITPPRNWKPPTDQPA